MSKTKLLFESFNDWGGTGYHKFSSVLEGDGVKIAPPGSYWTDPVVK